MKYAVEIERVGRGGYITRYCNGHNKTHRFATRAQAQAVADYLDDHANHAAADYRMRYEVIEIPEPEYVAERDPNHGRKEW